MQLYELLTDLTELPRQIVCANLAKAHLLDHISMHARWSQRGYHMFWIVYDIIFLWYHMPMISWFYIYDIIPLQCMIIESVTYDIIGLWYHNQYHMQNHISSGIVNRGTYSVQPGTYNFVPCYSIIPPCTAPFEYGLFYAKYLPVRTFFPKYVPSMYCSNKYVLSTYWVQDSW